MNLDEARRIAERTRDKYRRVGTEEDGTTYLRVADALDVLLAATKPAEPRPTRLVVIDHRRGVGRVPTEQWTARDERHTALAGVVCA